jgi:hypothetical protein
MPSHASFDASMTGFYFLAVLPDITAAVLDDIDTVLKLVPSAFRKRRLAERTESRQNKRKFSHRYKSPMVSDPWGKGLWHQQVLVEPKLR